MTIFEIPGEPYSTSPQKEETKPFPSKKIHKLPTPESFKALRKYFRDLQPSDIQRQGLSGQDSHTAKLAAIEKKIQSLWIKGKKPGNIDQKMDRLLEKIKNLQHDVQSVNDESLLSRLNSARMFLSVVNGVLSSFSHVFDTLETFSKMNGPKCVFVDEKGKFTCGHFETQSSDARIKFADYLHDLSLYNYIFRTLPVEKRQEMKRYLENLLKTYPFDDVRKAVASLIDALEVSPSQIEAASEEQLPGQELERRTEIGPELPLAESFIRGRGEEAVEKMKRQAPSSLERRIVLGPKQKSMETQRVHNIVSSMLLDLNSVTFSRHIAEDQTGSKVTYMVTLRTGEQYDLEELLRKVDFSHIQLTTEEFDAYAKLFSSTFVNRPKKPEEMPSTRTLPTDEYFNDGFDRDLTLSPEERKSLKALSLPQKFAINVYTGIVHEWINSLMRVQLDFLEDLNEDGVNGLLKEALLHTVAAHSALSELPNYTAPTEASGGHFLYRGEQAMPDDVIKERVLLAKEHGISREMGFVSLSHTKPEPIFFENGGVIIDLEGIVAKNLSALTQFPGEREVTMLPTEIQWEVSAEVMVEKKTGEMKRVTLLYGKPVRLIEGDRTSWLEPRL